MSEITDIIKQLEHIYDEKDCECLDEPPYKKCKMCTAAHALNEIGEIARDAVKEVTDETD